MTAAALILLGLAYWVGTRSGAGRSTTPRAVAHGEEAGVTARDTIWTCSMHPQIRMHKPGKCPICFMDLIALAESGDGGGDESDRPTLTMSPNAKILAGIATAAAVRRGVNSEIRMVGKVDYDETRLEMITARIAGRIDRLYVDYTGVPVQRGDHLALVYSPELVSLQRELVEAQRMVTTLAEGASPLVRNGAQQTLNAAKEKLRLLGFSDTELRSILERQTTTDHMTIRAGQKGVVIKKLVEEGMYVMVGTPLFHIADLSKVWVMLDAYESDLTWLRLGQSVDFEVEAWPGEMFKGTISFINPIVEPATRTVKVRVIVDNPGGKLKPDMFVRAIAKADVSETGGVKSSRLVGMWVCPMHPQVVKNKPGTCDICGMPLVPAEELGYVAAAGDSKVDPLIIPATAPLLTGKRAVVYVEVEGSEQPTYEGREVVLGPRVGNYYVVRSGIAEGEKVVVNGAFKIDGELQIRAKRSMMNPDGGKVQTGHEEHLMAPTAVSQSVPDISDKPASKDFVLSLSPLYDEYLKAASALAGDDDAKARGALKKVAGVASAVKAPAGEQYAAWRTSTKAMASALEHIDHMSGLEAARGMFEKVSTQVIVVAKHYGHVSENALYVAFCPMAFGKKGAYWIQDTDTIANPYYGARMLTCGEIREKL